MNTPSTLLHSKTATAKTRCLANAKGENSDSRSLGFVRSNNSYHAAGDRFKRRLGEQGLMPMRLPCSRMETRN